MKAKSKKIIIGTLLFLTVFFTVLFLTLKVQSYFQQKAREQAQNLTLTEAQSNTISKNKAQLLTQLPKQAYLEAQFICQAPLETLENWKLHENSCEEAALLQSYLYETGIYMTKEQANLEILHMIDWQNKNFGGQHDLHADQFKKFALDYYKLNENQVQIIKNVSIKDIKQEIASGHTVIVPIMGDILKNPYYPYPGYHMLIAIGYTETKIITNDNGTKKGKSFSYDTKLFLSAMKAAGGDIVILKLN